MARIEVVCACVLWVAGTALAQNGEGDGPGPVDTSQSLSAGVEHDVVSDTPGHASGTYMGVVPGGGGSAPKVPQARKGSPTITWPGFQMLPDGSSRVFIQSTAPIEPKVLQAADGKFELRLPGARIAAQTNRLPLDTRFFNTPVTKVSVNVGGAGATVQLDMRATVTPQVTSVPGNAGFYFTYIDLPKGEYIKGAQTPSTAAPAKPASKVIGKPVAASPASASVGTAPGSATWSAGIKLGKQ